MTVGDNQRSPAVQSASIPRTGRRSRGRGLARAAVLAAVRAARGAGADLVFLGADEEDWPKHMYAKLGFDEVSRSYDFVIRPARQRA